MTALTLEGVSPGLGAEDGEVDVGLPAVDDRVRLLARPLRSLLRRHDHLQNKDRGGLSGWMNEDFSRNFFC